MKQRLITAAVGLALFVVVMFFYATIVFNIALALVGVLAVYELLLATKYMQNKLLTACSLAFAAAVPFLRMFPIRRFAILFVFLFVMLLFAILLFGHHTVRLEQIGLVFFVSLFFPFATTSLIYIRDDFAASGYDMRVGMCYTLLIFACAWGADAGAYFIGRFFGKRKLAPEISPNKTVEGFFGGFLGCFLAMGLIVLLFTLWLGSEGTPLPVNYLSLVLCGIAGTLLSVFGDLSASIIKRQCSIKDFGSLIPGHGGVVDRFDSIFFVAPFFYVMMNFLPILP